MRIAQDARFVAERERFQLRFACEHCAHFDEVRDACAHEYPTSLHRLARYEDRSADLVFCKEWELR